MPLSVHSKPRNKHRRLKGRIASGHHRPVVSERSMRRRFLRGAADHDHAMRLSLEKDFRARGVSWRAVETTVHLHFSGNWTKFIDALAKFVKEQHVTKEEEVGEEVGDAGSRDDRGSAVVSGVLAGPVDVREDVCAEP